MKRTPLKRQTPLRSRSRPERRTPMAKVNRERRRLRFERAYESPERVAWMHTLPCCACGRRDREAGRIDVHHVRSRRAGGTADDTVPLCSRCHDRLHRIGRERFERTWCCPTLNLERRAAWYAKRWRRVRERWEAA